MHRRPLAQRVGRFRLLEELGRGGMGVVYRASDPASGREVALKVLLAADHAGDEAIRRFQREAETARLVDHPNVVKVHELGWHEGKPYFTMDLVEGGSLEQMRGRIEDPIWYARVLEGVARGLHAAHQRGLAHRDVKPSNILMDGDTPRVTDFGLARELSGVGERLTATGEVLGTPHYMAPEQAGNDGFDPARGDQYSVGAVLYDLLAGRPPHDGDSPVAVMMSLATTDPPPLRAVAPDVPVGLARIVEQALSRDPRRRYPDCEALADDLHRFVLGQPVQARATTWRMRADRALLGARRPATWAVAFGAAAFLGVGAVATWSAMAADRAAVQRELLAQGDLQATHIDIDAALERDDPRAALEVLGRFATRHRGTRTAVDAVLRETPRIDDAPDGVLALLAEAYTSSPDPSDQDRVLAALAERLEARWDWAGLAAVTATQARRHPLRAESPALAAPRARVHLALGDAQRAADVFAAIGDPDAERLARATAQLASAPDGLVAHRPVDFDGDGRLDLVARTDDGVSVHALAPGLPVARSVPLPGSDDERLHLLPGRRLVHWVEGTLRLLDLSGPSAVVLAERPDSSAALDAALVDLDGNGTPEVYVGLGPYQRRLLRFDPLDPEAGFVDAHGPTTAAQSDVTQLLPVDDDAGPFLWAAVGPWTAYDVRRYGMGPDGLAVVERRRLGFVPQLTALADGSVVALHSAEYPSRVAMDPETPTGPPPGVYLLTADGARAPALLPWSGPDARLTGLEEADVDGDGRPDLVISAQDRSQRVLAIHLRADEGYRPPLLVGGYEVLAAAQLDDDPAEELVVAVGTGERFGVLGTGGAAPIVAAPEVVPPQPPPEGLTPSAAAAWQRAEDLVAMGLYQPAADSFTRLQEQLPDALAPAALARAARLHEARGDREAAADAWSQLVGRAPDARQAAVTQLLAAHRFDEAEAIGGPAAPSGDTHWDLVAASRHADSLSLLDPAAARMTGEGLEVQAVAGEPAVAGVRLPWTGTHLALEVELDLTHLEWGGGLVVAVDGWEHATLAVRGWGGGGIYQRKVECLGVPGASLTLPSPTVSMDERWSLRLDWFDGEMLCRIAAPDGRVVSATRTLQPPPAGDLDVVLRPARHAPDTHALARATVRRWSVTATQALPSLSALPPAQRAPTVAHGLRLRPDAAVAELLATRGAAALLPFRDVHRALQHSHPDAPVTQRVYTVHAAPLLALDPDALDSELRVAYAELLARRGMAWLAIGDVDAARRDLAAADGLLDALPPSVEVADLLRVDVCLALASAWAAQAPEAARRHARRALQLHPVPELAADRMGAWPALRDLEGLWP